MLSLLGTNVCRPRHIDAVRCVVLQELALLRYEKYSHIIATRHCIQAKPATQNRSKQQQQQQLQQFHYHQQPPQQQQQQQQQQKQQQQAQQQQPQLEEEKHQRSQQLQAEQQASQLLPPYHKQQQQTEQQRPNQHQEHQHQHQHHEQQQQQKLQQLTLSQHIQSEAAQTPPEKKAAMSFDIDWIFPRLSKPSKLWYIASQIAITAVGLFSKFVLNVMSYTLVYNKERLVNLVGKRPKGVPLVTVSNHHSCFDDPGLWGFLPLRYLCNSVCIRWAMAAHDICFTNKIHSLFFMYGKCIPVVRGRGVRQPAIDLCIQKCAEGAWVHVFPEGKVNMSKEEIRLKWGVGRIVYESPIIPIILPIWHLGMDEVLPNTEPYILKWGKKVTINIGKPLDLNEFIQNLKDRKLPEPVARKLITDKIQAAFHDLRLETERLHNART